MAPFIDWAVSHADQNSWTRFPSVDRLFHACHMDEASMVTTARVAGGHKRRFVFASVVAACLAFLGVAGRAEESAQRIAMEPDAANSIQTPPGENVAEQGNGSVKSRWDQIVAGVAEAALSASQALNSLGPKLQPVPGLPKAWIAAHQTCFPRGRDKPDCGVAAQLVCSTAGYETGKAIDVASGQFCRGGLPATADAPAVAGPTETCKSKSWVTLAACW